ncbi:COMM domain-containing protein 2 [Acyrthosiphon pisum]|uniref:ACYPI007450 protein n=1 Tax=Acyrthosiphon pisum TaxID=7029 RepID=C4WUY4_ACYPI|nr:COMM domain-containing protein 2 [Acyrthosiphon pisum]BAH71704.1 ACYPI007450 [Acyrthosiphon pisum]|eukprot:NP_001156241.1 COMM domain-containing protein 2 [Acyrthosiphon pisum]
MSSVKEVFKISFQLLAQQTDNVIKDFLRLTKDFMDNGPNSSLYNKAAEKLQIDEDKIISIVKSICLMCVQSCKHKLTDLEIKESLTEYGFNETKLDMIILFFENQKPYLLDILSSSALVFPHFKELEWRFETDMGSRSLLHQTVPVVTLKLDLEKKGISESLFLQTNPLNLVHIKDTLEAALKQNQSQWIRKIRRKLK